MTLPVVVLSSSECVCDPLLTVHYRTSKVIGGVHLVLVLSTGVQLILTSEREESLGYIWDISVARKGWERGGKGVGKGWERGGKGVEKELERGGKGVGKGWERGGRGVGKGWERGGRGV